MLIHPWWGCLSWSQYQPSWEDADPGFSGNPGDKQQSSCVGLAGEMSRVQGALPGAGWGSTFLWPGFFTLKTSFSLSQLITYHAQFILFGISGNGYEDFRSLWWSQSHLKVHVDFLPIISVLCCTVLGFFLSENCCPISTWPLFSSQDLFFLRAC